MKFEVFVWYFTTTCIKMFDFELNLSESLISFNAYELYRCDSLSIKLLPLMIGNWLELW